jgi:alpha-beta hydrolase superfamily lysophospholipase
MLHTPPDGRARAGVVLCSPLGLEELYAYSTYRCLAEGLEANGFAALRFDYDGTGDSGGDQYDPGRVEAWLGSIEAAIELLRGCGLTFIAVVGMRMGATLAAAQLARDPVDALVLWDPCPSGRAYLREHRALQAFSLETEGKTDGSVETPGFLYLAETVRELSPLNIAKTTGDLASRVLLLTRPDRARSIPLDERLGTGLHIQRDEAIGQFELLNVPTREGQVPEQMVDRIVAWLSETVDPVDRPVNAPPVRKAVVGYNDQRQAIVESAIRIGSAGLFGIMTEVEDGRVGPIVVCLNTSLERRIGPSRMWVDLARQWARAGARVLRVEISGVGDSGVHPGQVPFVIHPPEALDDISEIINAMSAAESADVVLVGLCSGAYHALEGGLVLPVRGICAVNPLFTFTPPEMSSGDIDPRRQTIGEMKPWVKRLPAWWRVHQALTRLPDSAWWPVNRFGLLHPPARTLRRLVDRDVEVLVIAGYFETQKIKRGAGRALRRLVQSGRFRFDTVDKLDHSLFEFTGRERVQTMLYEYVVDQFVAQNGTCQAL